ncbi:IPT/TIG domain-containing protein [Renibacterium salmoninarum]|uniref:IPT/TIG domain-containing protein n=1 Tax=Renibacterium salmoninarum TaxID=1646 RepID=UPI000DF82949|nr:IPT/TIG domain-containing protein [Renibacterium salmoninarum]
MKIKKILALTAVTAVTFFGVAPLAQASQGEGNSSTSTVQGFSSVNIFQQGGYSAFFHELRPDGTSSAAGGPVAAGGSYSSGDLGKKGFEDGDLVVPVVNAVFGNEQKGSSFVYNKDGPAKELKVWGTTLNVGFGCNDNAPSPMGCGPANKPVASGLQPPAGPLGGGTVVKVDGSNLFGASQVSFGDKPGTDIAVAQDGNSLTVKTPAVDAAGPVKVTVTNPGGETATYESFHYFGSAPTAATLEPKTGPRDGGTVVKVNGGNLFDVSRVTFGDNEATEIHIAQDGNSLTVKTPAVDAAGPVEVKVSTPNGSATATDKFEYVGSDQHPDIHAPDGATPVTGKWWSGDNNTYGGWFKDGQWVLQKPNAGSVSVAFGNPGDTPVTGDWDGKGRFGIGVERGGQWYLSNAGTSIGKVTAIVAFGNPGDTPVTGDWDGKGKTSIGVTRSTANGLEWYITSDLTTANPPVSYHFIFGNSTDAPITGNWIGTAKTQVGLHRENSILISYDAQTVASTHVFGNAGDVAVTGQWNGEGKTSFGVFEHSSGAWKLSNDLSGKIDITFN